MTVSIQDQLKEAKREVALRRKVYPRWIYEGRLTEEESCRHIAAMDAIVETLASLIDKQVSLFPVGSKQNKD